MVTDVVGVEAPNYERDYSCESILCDRHLGKMSETQLPPVAVLTSLCLESKP